MTTGTIATKTEAKRIIDALDNGQTLPVIRYARSPKKKAAARNLSRLKDYRGSSAIAINLSTLRNRPYWFLPVLLFR